MLLRTEGWGRGQSRSQTADSLSWRVGCCPHTTGPLVAFREQRKAGCSFSKRQPAFRWVMDCGAGVGNQGLGG